MLLELFKSLFSQFQITLLFGFLQIELLRLLYGTLEIFTEPITFVHQIHFVIYFNFELPLLFFPTMLQF